MSSQAEPIEVFSGELNDYEKWLIKSGEVNPDNVTIDHPIAVKLLGHYKRPEGFNKVGFARPLGGLFYQYFYAILGGLIIMLTFSKILAVLYPFPDSKAYAGVGNILFSFLFFVMNIPTNFSLERFIAEWRVKNPLKMLMYIRFYIWYQMMTGIFLVAGTSIFVLFYLKTGNLVYTKYLLLIYVSKEYPAMLDMFRSALKGLQQFQYDSKIGFIAQTFVQPLCEYGFVLIGKYVIGSDPRFGEMMGIAIGYAIGTYVDDFISMYISSIYLKKVLKPYGFTLIDCIVPEIDKDVWKSALIFGLKLSPPGFLNALLGFFAFFWWYDLVPTYATLIVLNSTADQIGNMVRRAGGLYMKPVISESLNNDKKELTHYYIANTLKINFMTMFGMAVVLFSFLPIILEMLLAEGGAENWLLMVGFVVPNILASTLEPVMFISKDVILGGNRPAFYSAMEILSSIGGFLVDFTLLFILKWPQRMGISALMWLIPMKMVPINLLRLIIEWRFINRNLVKIRVKDFIWQTLVAPIPASLVVVAFAEFWFKIIYPLLHSSLNIYISGAITVIFAISVLLWVYFPVYAYFGGWDDYNLAIFNEAVEISGPSKFLFKPIVHANKLLLKYSKFHNKFAIPWKDADREAEELMKEAFIKEKLIALKGML